MGKENKTILQTKGKEESLKKKTTIKNLYEKYSKKRPKTQKSFFEK